MNIIQLSKDNREDIIELMDKTTDEQGYIIDRRTNNRVKCRYTKEEIHIEDDFSILPGSTIFVKNKDLALVKYMLKR